jgi:hypothetical protein
MSYPGPLSASVNLGCDTSLQRATDTFSFQLNTGAAGNESTLDSPASIIPDGTGNVSLSMISGAGSDTSTLTIAGGAAPGAVSGINITGGAPQLSLLTTTGNASLTVASNSGNLATLAIATSAGGLSSLLMGQTGTPNAAVRVTAAADGSGQLKIENATTGTSVAMFDTQANNVTLGSLATAGTINLNASTVIKESASGVNGLALSPTSATQSVIAQTISNGGTLNLGSSVQNSDIIALRDTGAANTGSILIGGNGGTGIVMTGSINNAATTITTDRTAGNFASLTIGANIGVPVLQFSDSGASFIENVSTSINSTLTLGGDLNMGTDGVIRNYANYQTTGNAALGVGATATITSTNPPPNGVGLYCITIYAPSDITANVSGVAYWNGSIWYGGSTGNAAFRIQTAPAFNALTLFNTSSVAMAGVWQSNVFQILGPTTA